MKSFTRIGTPSALSEVPHCFYSGLNFEFSVDGQGCVPSLLCDMKSNSGEVMKIMVASFKRSHAGTAAFSAFDPAAATADPRLHWRLLDTHGQVWVSLFWGHCSFLLGPSEHKILFVPSKSLFPQSCVSSGSSVVYLMVTSSNKAYAIPRSTAPRAPAPASVHCRRHSNTVLSQSLWDLWVLVHTRFV